MPDDGLAHALGLRLGRAERLQFPQGDEAALKLEGHVGGGAVGGRRGEVVEEADEGPGFEEGVAGGGRDPVREVLGYYGVACTIYVR